MPLNTAGPRQSQVPIEEVLAPQADSIHKWIREERLQLTRVQELLGQRDCRVLYTSLRRFVVRMGWLGKSSRTTVRMTDTDPEEVAKVDFGRLGLMRDPESGRRYVVWGMLIVLCHSRHSFLQRLTAQQSTDLHELIIARHRHSSFVTTSNRASEEWLGLFDYPILTTEPSTTWPMPAIRPSSRAAATTSDYPRITDRSC